MDLSTMLAYAAAAVAAFYLLKAIYMRMFKIEDDIPTFFDVPLVFTPRDELPKLHVSGLRRMKQAGPVSRTINALWPWDRTILVGDPNLLKEILVGKNWTKFERGGNPYAEPHGPYSNGIISLANNQRWRDTRAMFERTFTTVNVRRYTPILLDLRDVLLQELEKANNANPAGFDLFVRFHAFTFDVITRLTFGSEIKAQTTEAGAKYSHKFDRWLACSNIMSLVYSLFGKWAYALIPKIVEEWSDAGRTFFGLIQTEKERIERGDHRASIMDDAYAIAMSEKMPASMTDESLQKALMSVLFAGHDTTAVLLSFLAYELSKRPDLQSEIRKEIAAVAGDAPLDNLEVLEQCKVLNACIKETLRMYPSAPFGAGRCMDQDYDFSYTDLGGVQRTIKFKKGDRVMPYLYGIQNFEPFWGKNPAVWEPSRFYDEANGDTKAGLFAYSPFGNGGRRCLGERLALAEARLSMASILRKWDIVHVPETTWKFDQLFQGTIRPTAVMVQLKPVEK